MIRRLLVVGILAMFVAGCSSQAAPSAPSGVSAVSVPTAPDAVAVLLARQGWQPTGSREESTTQLPADFKLRSGFPWRYIVDYSLDVGLNLEPYAGQSVRMVIQPVDDVRGGRLEAWKPDHDFRAYILLDPRNDSAVGAYLEPIRKDGERERGAPGPSLSGRDLEAVTGLSYFEYVQKYRAEPLSPARLAAERPLNAIHDYFRAASRHDCAELGTLLTEKAKLMQQAICDSYAPFASLRVIGINGYAKADTPQRFRFVPIDQVADQYHVVLEVNHKAGERSPWPEGIIRLLIPLVQEADGQWRLGLAAVVPEG